MDAHTRPDPAAPAQDSAPAGRPTIVRLKDGGLALVKTVGGRRMVIRRYERHEEPRTPSDGELSSLRPGPHGGEGVGHVEVRGAWRDAAPEAGLSRPIVQIEGAGGVQRLELAPLTQEVAERLNERAVDAFTGGLNALSSVLNVIEERLGRSESVSHAQVQVLQEIATSLNQANERSEMVVGQLQALPALLQSLQSSIDRQTVGMERRDHTLVEFRNTMADINQAIHELTTKQLQSMDRMGERNSEAMRAVTEDHVKSLDKIVGQQLEAWERMNVDQKDLVAKVTDGNTVMLEKLQRAQVDALEEVNQRQIQTFESQQQKALDLFSQAQAENIGVFARVQAEQARNMTEVLSRSQNAYKYLIITMMLLVGALVLIMAMKN